MICDWCGAAIGHGARLTDNGLTFCDEACYDKHQRLEGCPRCGARLTTDWDGEAVCPSCGTIYW